MIKQSHQTIKSAGVLLHVSSLPSGDFGHDAFLFVDFLRRIGANVWQTLPLNMPHDDGSPYQCLSAHAGNPAFIDLKAIHAQGWLSDKDLASRKPKSTKLMQAYVCFNKQADKKAKKSFDDFCRQQAFWLDDFALFLVLRNFYAKVSWYEWPLPFKTRHMDALSQFSEQHASEIAVIKFTQYIFFTQWHALKAYANQYSIKLFGDVPIFVAYDSSDVWAHPNMFKLDTEGCASVVAGVPPDYFSITGQRWGNPHYHWENMQADGFSWWVARMATQHAMFDIVRIDHFRGLEAAWEIPASEPTAINGSWVQAPGDELLAAIRQHFPDMKLVAEDLGIITDEVDALRLKHGLPGMKILQFAFDGSEDNPYLPKFIGSDSVVYTGTHDNDTTLGWYQSLTEEQRQPLHLYLNNPQPDMPEALIEMAMESAAEMAIIPMQDILKLGSAHRMNIPGTMQGNWQWRFQWKQLHEDMTKKIQSLIAKSHRKH